MASRFAFSETSFYAESAKKWQRAGLPQPIKNLKMASMHCVAFGTNGSYFYAYKDVENKNWYNWSPNLKEEYPGLVEWLDSKKGSIIAGTIYVSLGLSGCFYTYGPGLGCHRKFSAGYPDLEKEWGCRLSMDGKFVMDPKIITMGANGAWVLVGKKGDFAWDLKGLYSNLEELLKTITRGIELVALHPWKKQWYFIKLTGGGSPGWTYVPNDAITTWE